MTVVAEIALGIVLGFAIVRIGSVLLRTLWLDYFGLWYALALPREKHLPRWYHLVTMLVTGQVSR